jgi:hypothetical protein
MTMVHIFIWGGHEYKIQLPRTALLEEAVERLRLITGVLPRGLTVDNSELTDWEMWTFDDLDDKFWGGFRRIHRVHVDA